MIKKILSSAFLLASIPLLNGCFHDAVDKRDPYENFNRPMFAFNMTLDHLFLRPITHVYTFVTPKPVQKGVTNAFNNVDEVITIPNDILQGKFLFMLNDVWRVVLNSTVGIAGLFDVAKHMGLRPHYETFGLTLAYWQGNQQSPYLVLPFIGPGTFRSAYGTMMDVPASPFFLIPWDYWYVDVGLRGLNLVNRRSALMEANRMIDTAFDPYVFVRSAYTQTMDKITAENQVETFHSKNIVSQNVITVQDYQNAENTTDLGTGTGAGETEATSVKKAEENGFIFDNDEATTTPTKTKMVKASSTGAKTTTHPSK